jgi:proline dehydrogenase
LTKVRQTIPKADQEAFDTAPPGSARRSVWLGWKSSVKDRISASVLPLVRQAARPYLGGETVDDALCVAQRLARENLACTLGFWDTVDYSGSEVAASYRSAIDHLSDSGLDSYVSIKPPALRFDPALAVDLAAAAAPSHCRLHCDSHGVDVADRSNAMLQAMVDRYGGAGLGTTLPGRWARSLTDADWAIAQRLNVRVVKGQWPDPDDPRRDMSAGFLQIVDRLAGQAPHIAVATHDLRLATQAIAKIQPTGTAFELELLFGMPMQPLLRWAADNAVKTRIYVPFGKGFIPDALRLLRHNPRLIWSIARHHAC